VSEVKRVKKVKKAKPTADANWQSRSGRLARRNRSPGITQNGRLVLVGVVWEQTETDFDLDVFEGGRARSSFAPDKRQSISTLTTNPPLTRCRFRVPRCHECPQTADSGRSIFSFCGEQNQLFGRSAAARFLGKVG
jgi:hypothetical protein